MTKKVVDVALIGLSARRRLKLAGELWKALNAMASVDGAEAEDQAAGIASALECVLLHENHPNKHLQIMAAYHGSEGLLDDAVTNGAREH